MSPAMIIRRQLRVMERGVQPLEDLRELSKKENGRLTPFGKNLIRFMRDNEVKQAVVAKVFDITPGAVSQHYNKA
jgi:hypothetical protein